MILRGFGFDAVLATVNLALLLYLVGYMIYRRRFTHGGNLLLGLIMMLAITGFADLFFRYFPNPTVILLANVYLVFCGLWAMTITVHFSLFAFSRARFLWANELYLLLYLPALTVSLLYAATPLMLAGIFYTPLGFRLIYGPAYWAVVILGMSLAAFSFLLELGTLIRNISRGENNQAVISLVILGLLSYYFCYNLLLPFLSRSSVLIGGAPVSLAVAVLIFEFVRYHYVSLEEV
ncbi:MAG: hypothetical protein MUC35_02820 [Candidatus Margulisbacteria bacterium]|jgi:hypothetical protein|nr:hypothetical protein [Candidatus Margulisiibacteriota bacterium]